MFDLQPLRHISTLPTATSPTCSRSETQSLVSLPYSVQTNDVLAYFEMKVSVPEFKALLRRQFDTLYREGETIPRVMAIAVHPFVTGQPHRIGALDAALEYICAHAGVWRATGWEIVQHFLRKASGECRSMDGRARDGRSPAVSMPALPGRLQN
jgi:hypothetical protein